MMSSSKKMRGMCLKILCAILPLWLQILCRVVVVKVTDPTQEIVDREARDSSSKNKDTGAALSTI